MQLVITWWCTFIGITDPLSIQIASGIVGGSTLIYLPFVAWWLLTAIAGTVCPMMRGGRRCPTPQQVCLVATFTAAPR
jgi:hypothetical protein